MTANVETMAHFSNVIATPWHGMSTAIPTDSKSMSNEEIAELAGINWTVSQRIARIRVNPDTDETIEINDTFFTVRDTDNKVFGGSTSGRYVPVQNIEILDFFRAWIDAGDIELSSIGALKDGAVIFATAKTGKSFLVHGMDATDQYLTFARSHDGSLQNEIWNTGVCTVCCNTLALARKDIEKNGSIKRKSTKNLNVMGLVSEAKDRLGYSQESFAQFHETAEWLSERPMEFNGNLTKEFLINLTDDKVLKTLVTDFKPGRAEKLVTDDMLSRVALKIQDAMLTGPGQELAVRQNTAWGVLNGVTHYVDHLTGQAKSNDQRAVSSMFGTGAALKARATELIMEYAGI